MNEQEQLRQECARLMEQYLGIETTVAAIVREPEAARVYDEFKWIYYGQAGEPVPEVTRERALFGPCKYDLIRDTGYSQNGDLVQVRFSSAHGLPRSQHIEYLVASRNIYSEQEKAIEWGVTDAVNRYSNGIQETILQLQLPEAEMVEEEWLDPLKRILERRDTAALFGRALASPQIVLSACGIKFSDGEGPLLELAPFSDIVVKVERLQRMEHRRKELLERLGRLGVEESGRQPATLEAAQA